MNLKENTETCNGSLEGDPWFERELVCPRDKSKLLHKGTALICPKGHSYPIVDGIPVMLFIDEHPTMPKAFQHTISLAKQASEDNVSLSNRAYRGVHPFVQQNLITTCGRRLFSHSKGKLTSYPIPSIPLPPPKYPGQEMLDIGCNWGRWSIAAARKGYHPVGIDPMLEAVLAARDVTREMGLKARFLCGDARHLPFRDGSFEVVHSYGVLQHFHKDNSRQAIKEAGRVLKPGGISLIQMTAKYGALALSRQLKYAFRFGTGDPGGFEVRHWSPAEIRSFFENAIGPTDLFVDGYFTILPQPGDLSLLLPRHRAIMHMSAMGQSLSRIFPPLVNLADSLYASSLKPL